MHLKYGYVVYVEPGEGWGYVSKEPDAEGNIEVYFYGSCDIQTITTNEDNVFPLHEESFFNHICRIKDSLMFYAANYDCPDEKESKEILEELETLLKLANQAKSKGQFRQR